MRAMRFSGKTVIVTGGSCGIGLACVHAFAREGARVFNVDLIPFSDDDRLRFEEIGSAVQWHQGDLGKEEAVAGVVQNCCRRFGSPDILVNNAAYVDHMGGDLGATSLMEWKKQLDVTLTGMFLLTRDVLASMVEHKEGSIVNVASIGGILPFASAAAYSIAKAAVLQMTRSIAIDYGRRGIRCNAVAPGPIQTETFTSIQSDPFELRDRECRTAVGRIGKPDEVAAAILFLAGDEASFITGTTLPVDGGWSAIQWNPHLGPRSLS